MDFSHINTIPIGERNHKVKAADLASMPAGKGFADFYDSLPDLLAAKNLKKAARAIARAASQRREVILAMGAHPVKCGLSPLILHLMDEGIVTCVAMNGAVAIHDFELAYIGETSEDVAETLKDGSFGMVEETGRLLNGAMAEGVADGLGAGAAIGRLLAMGGYDHTKLSILAAGRSIGVDVTLHIAIGTDTIHAHPSADGAVLGKASHTDFKTFCDHVSRLEEGVFINLGSAVIMPEVFLKALSVARNLGHGVRKFTAINIDMLRQYRPAENVLRRPALTGATAIDLRGHHELLLPLLVSAVELERERI